MKDLEKSDDDVMVDLSEDSDDDIMMDLEKSDDDATAATTISEVKEQ